MNVLLYMYSTVHVRVHVLLYMYMYCTVHYIQHTLCDNRAGVTVDMLLVSNTSFIVSVFIGKSSPLDKLRV